MPLEPPSIGGAHHTVAVATLPRAVLEVLPLPIVAADSMHRELLPLEHSPPDIQVLNATFLINAPPSLSHCRSASRRVLAPMLRVFDV